ncbi:MAG: RNA polymerase sigma factor [Bdellovibrio sp.]|nr:RNA polymerase sigma factor [Bdellovibrio sp.]
MSVEKINWISVIERVLRNERPAVTELIQAAQTPLFTFCFHLCKNKQLAEDLTHDALLKSLSSLSQLQNQESYLPWAKKIARHLFLDYLKASENSKVHLQFDELPESADFTQDPISVEQIHASRTLQLLDEEDRTLLILIDIQEMSYEDAAVTLDHPIGTIKSKLSRARDKFSVLYNDNGTKSLADSSIRQELELKKKISN